MNDQRPSPNAAAYDALGRVFAASAMMALPGILGSWLGARWGVDWIGFVGFMIGPPIGLTYLLVAYRKSPRRGETPSSDSPDRD
ncbi:hypothetical protein Pla123a_27470 [Posidoniimonas polymericola]|uniref:F0F1-ATPase subunit (ATPase_gene1) n=1 Tax=Posidoniimonas polymericola TaxID=2528002 RepID=A0A5C5YM28_9BACT|nr:hypothetical protein [Posidoniimonas polymericola]TWT75962.1 hypothetical protein Pla123a_27470 [Posidoniimonas polymericola]